jgi:hypothetical protein
MSEWRREVEQDYRILATAIAILRDQERDMRGTSPEPGGSPSQGIQYSG